MGKIKNLFATPKKRVISVVALVCALSAVGTGTVFAANAVTERKFIGKEKAQNLAFTDAGIDPANVSKLHTELEKKNGKILYEVDFTADSTEYEYTISAKDGTVIEKDKDMFEKAPSKSEITAEEAKNIALNHASHNASDVTFVHAELDYDGGLKVYDVEFYVGNKEYDYEIDAQTGKILSYDYDAEAYKLSVSEKTPEVNPVKSDVTPSISDNTSQNPNNNTPNPVNIIPPKSEITVEEAKNIALNHASLNASDVTFIHAELDFDDGLKIYDVEFYSGNKEYDYEIDTQTGKILSYDYDADEYKPAVPEKKPEVTPQKPQVTPSAPEKNTQYIGVDKAKNIALSHAGLSLSEVTFVKTKFEDDDGHKEYEVEFYKGRMEYEYTIDALTGTITEYDSEYDD